MRLNRMIRTMPKTVPILGTTATANDRVIADLQQRFGDDVYISRWTLTVCGYLLTQAGCEFVFPFALADSSENRGNQD